MKRRFYFHYHKAKDMMTVHWNGQCHSVLHVVCYARTETKRRARQPRLVIQGFTTYISFEEGVARIH